MLRLTNLSVPLDYTEDSLKVTSSLIERLYELIDRDLTV